MNIPFTQAGIGSKLFHDYLAGKLPADLFSYPASAAGISEAVRERRSRPVDRELLVARLYSQYGDTELHAAVKANIETLRNPNTFTVTTGHQLCIYTGPLYFIYKIVSAIRLARQISEQDDVHVVPVYWMNSEDHDFEEISHFYFLNRKFEWTPGEATGGPVGRMSTAGLAEIPDEIRTSFTNLDQYAEIFSVFREAYSGSKNLAEATRRIANQLFGEHGLVIIDQDDAELKRSFLDIIRKDITGHASHRLVSETITRLESEGYTAQVKPREINFFYLGKGRRERIVQENGGYATVEKTVTWTPEELERELSEDPGRFSTNVVTRPLYQEFILPNLAYIGGPAEVHYWLQYRTMFSHYNIFFPALIMRDSFLLVHPKTMAKAAKLNLSLDDFFADEQEIIRKYLAGSDQPETALDDEAAKLGEIFATVRSKASAVDKTLEGMVNAEEQKMLNALRSVEARILKALRQKNDQQVQSIRDIRSKIYPDGAFQERRDNFLTYTARPAEFISSLLSKADPLQPVVKIEEL